jgi:hypothetical protein
VKTTEIAGELIGWVKTSCQCILIAARKGSFQLMVNIMEMPQIAFPLCE